MSGEEPNGQQEGFGRFSTIQTTQAPTPAARFANTFKHIFKTTFSATYSTHE